MSEVAELEVARYALRTFKFSRDGLESVAVPNRDWNNGVCEAHCRRAVMNGWWGPMWFSIVGGAVEIQEPTPHTSPDLNCSCGIYGSLSLDNLTAQYDYARNLVTVIAAEGITIIGSRGLRTQYARVVAWWLSSDVKPTMEEYLNIVCWDPYKVDFGQVIVPKFQQICAASFGDAAQYDDLDSMLNDFGLPRESDKAAAEAITAKNWWTD